MTLDTIIGELEKAAASLKQRARKAQYVIPAKVSFVADVAQFTPKSVETEEERQKLMFRVKAQISPELLQKHIKHVKTGLPGVAHVRLSSDAEWPKELVNMALP